MYHSIYIDDKNTWADWHLIPTSQPIVSLPTVREKSVEIPGMDGVIDLSEYLTGFPSYANRKGSWEFYISNEYFLYSDPKFVSNASNWSSLPYAISVIAGYCNGTVHTIRLEDDPDYTYEGRLTVTFTPRKDYSTVTISYDLSPYKTNLANGNKTLN